MGEEHEVGGDGCGEGEEELEAAVAVAEGEGLDGVGGEGDGLGRFTEQVAAYPSEDVIDTLEEDLAGEGAPGEAEAAEDPGAGEVPAVALGLGEEGAPGLGGGGKELAPAELVVGAGVEGADVAAAVLAVVEAVEDPGAGLAALGDSEQFHSESNGGRILEGRGSG